MPRCRSRRKSPDDGCAAVGQARDVSRHRRAQPPLDEVAGHRISDCFRNDKTDHGRSATLAEGEVVDDHGRSSGAHTFANRPTEVGRTPKAVRRRKHRSGGELDAALTTACGEDGAAGTGRHAGAEAVGLRTAPVVRLESPLAHEITPER